MLGSKSILSACLSKVLAAYLEVDRREIETSLLSKDGKLVLRNVRVKKLEIPVCSTKGGTRYMVISGTIKEFSVTWKWSSLSSLVQDSSLSIQGVRLKSSFLTKEDPPEENSTKEENLSKDNRVTSFFINELRRVKSGISMSLVESEIIRKPLENILDTFSIRYVNQYYIRPVLILLSQKIIIENILSCLLW